MDHPVGDVSGPSLRGADRRRAHGSYRRALAISLAISAAIHVFVLAVYPRLLPKKPSAGDHRFLVPIVSSGGGAMRALQLVVVGPSAPEKPAKPESPTAPKQPSVETEVPKLGEQPGVPYFSPGAAAEALKPHLTDPRIWEIVDSAYARLTLRARLELSLSSRLQEISDSMVAAEAAHRRMTDWTFTDKNGKKWGVKDGKLIIDGVAVPIPLTFGVPVGQRDAAEKSAWEWREIQQGSAAIAAHQSWKEREKAMEERRNRERAKAKPDTTGGGA